MMYFNPWMMQPGISWDTSNAIGELSGTTAQITAKNTVREAVEIMASEPGQFPFAEVSLAKSPVNTTQNLSLGLPGFGDVLGPGLDIPIVRPSSGGSDNSSSDFSETQKLIELLLGGIPGVDSLNYLGRYKLSDIIPSIILGLLAIVLVGIGIYQLTK